MTAEKDMIIILEEISVRIKSCDWDGMQRLESGDEVEGIGR